MLIYHLWIKTVNIHEKNSGCGIGEGGGGGGAKSPPPLHEHPLPSDNVPLSLTNCLPPKTDPAG